MSNKKPRKQLKAQAQDCPTTKKRSFESKEAAEYFLTAYLGKRVYRCNFCGNYHITNQELRSNETRTRTSR